MNKIILSILMILLTGMVVLLGIGFLMTTNETNINNFKNITLADSTTIGIPSDFTVTNPFSNYTDNDGYYYSNCDLESKNYGWIHIEYTRDPIETMVHSSNSTDAIDADNDGVYEFNVYDIDGHRVMKIRGSNPAVVKAIGKTVKFNTNGTIKTINNTTIVKEEVVNVNTSANNNKTQANYKSYEAPNSPTSVASLKQQRDTQKGKGELGGMSDEQIERGVSDQENGIIRDKGTGEIIGYR